MKMQPKDNEVTITQVDTSVESHLFIYYCILQKDHSELHISIFAIEVVVIAVIILNYFFLSFLKKWLIVLSNDWV